MKRITTSFLFADESFLTGMGSMLDIGGTSAIFNTSSTSEEADTKAIASDWAMVGQDIANAIEEYKQSK